MPRTETGNKVKAQSKDGLAASAPHLGQRHLNWPDAIAWHAVLMPILLDYKGQSSSLFTIIYAFVTLICLTGTLWFLFRYSTSRNIPITASIAVTSIFVASTILASLFSNQDVDSIVRGLAPIAIFLFGLIAVSALMESGATPIWFWRQTIIAAAFGAIFNVALVVMIQGLSLQNVRYQILGGFTPLLVAFTLGTILLGQWNWWKIGLVLFNAVLIVLSVTRTQIFVALAGSSAILIFARENILKIRNLPTFLIGTIVLTIGIFALASFIPGNQLDRWATRLIITSDSPQSLDITQLTRQAQAEYQIERMGSEPQRALLGFGIAAESRFSSTGSSIISQILGYEYAKWSETGIGHNNYIGTLYVGGILAGGGLIILKFWSIIISGRLIRILSSSNVASASILIAAPLGVISYLSFGLLGGYFGSRSASLCLALSIGFTIWQLSIKPIRPLRRTRLPRS